MLRGQTHCKLRKRCFLGNISLSELFWKANGSATKTISVLRVNQLLNQLERRRLLLWTSLSEKDWRDTESKVFAIPYEVFAVCAISSSCIVGPVFDHVQSQCTSWTFLYCKWEMSKIYIGSLVIWDPGLDLGFP